MDTIAAIATPIGFGAVGIVRVCGPGASGIGESIFRMRTGKRCPFLSHRLYHGWLHPPEAEAPLDEVLVVLMRKPRSYTGEDILEIHCHGGVLVMEKILAAVVTSGARPALPGEFTRRAFLNGRLSLAQAEAVAEIISARTDEGLALAVGHLGGDLTARIESLRGGLIEIMALIEASLDLVEDEPHLIDSGEVTARIDNLSRELTALGETYRQGRLLSSGISMVIIGRPNVGKSSLLNRLAEKKRAIVTEIPGTTRDLLEDLITIRGIPVRVVDTAGIRRAQNIIEQEGIDLVWQELKEADVVLALLDGSGKLQRQDLEIIRKNRDKNTLIVINKSDLDQRITREEVSGLFPELSVINISAKLGSGLPELKEGIYNLVAKKTLQDRSAVVVTNLRHKLALMRARDLLARAGNGIRQGLSWEFPSLDIKEAAESLGEITGEVVCEDVLERIFSRFCLGK